MSVGIAVVGAGTLGQRHARVWAQLPLSHLIGVVDLDESRARDIAAPLGATWATSLDGYLTDDSVDAIAIATPDHLHLDVAIAALHAGKHILVEKPLATTVPDAQLIVDVAAAAGLVAAVNFSQRWLEEYAYVKGVIDSGEIGNPQFGVSVKRDSLSVPTRMISWAAASSPVFFMTSHDLDLVRWFLESEPVSVVAHETSGVLRQGGIDVHDSVHALVTFGNGACVTFSTAWIHPEAYPVLAEDRVEIVGSAGVLEYHSRTRRLEVHNKDHAREVHFSGPATATEIGGSLVGAFVDSCEHFVTSIQRGLEPHTSAKDSLRAITCQQAVMQSARAGGRRVDVD